MIMTNSDGRHRGWTLSHPNTEKLLELGAQVRGNVAIIMHRILGQLIVGY